MLDVSMMNDGEIWDLCREFYGNDMATCAAGFRAAVAKLSVGATPVPKLSKLRTAADQLCNAIRDYYSGGPMNEQIAENLRETEDALVDLDKRDYWNTVLTS